MEALEYNRLNGIAMDVYDTILNVDKDVIDSHVDNGTMGVVTENGCILIIPPENTHDDVIGYEHDCFHIVGISSNVKNPLENNLIIPVHISNDDYMSNAKAFMEAYADMKECLRVISEIMK